MSDGVPYTTWSVDIQGIDDDLGPFVFVSRLDIANAARAETEVCQQTLTQPGLGDEEGVTYIESTRRNPDSLPYYWATREDEIERIGEDRLVPRHVYQICYQLDGAIYAANLSDAEFDLKHVRPYVDSFRVTELRP